MKRFDLITEADARVLAHGEAVLLARNGHITPLAVDTLRERRATAISAHVGENSGRNITCQPPGLTSKACPQPTAAQ